MFIKTDVNYDYARRSYNNDVIRAINDLSEGKFLQYAGFSGDPNKIDDEITQIAEKSKKVSIR